MTSLIASLVFLASFAHSVDPADSSGSVEDFLFLSLYQHIPMLMMKKKPDYCINTAPEVTSQTILVLNVVCN